MTLTNTQKVLILIPACALLAGVCAVFILPQEEMISAALLLLLLAVIYLILLVVFLKKKALHDKKPHEDAGFHNSRNYVKAVNQKSYTKGNVTRNYHNVKH